MIHGRKEIYRRFRILNQIFDSIYGSRDIEQSLENNFSFSTKTSNLEVVLAKGKKKEKQNKQSRQRYKDRKIRKLERKIERKIDRKIERQKDRKKDLQKDRKIERL